MKIRIRRMDRQNLVIDHITNPQAVLKGKLPKWEPYRYYGTAEDLANGLLNYVIDIPEGNSIVEQIATLKDRYTCWTNKSCRPYPEGVQK